MQTLPDQIQHRRASKQRVVQPRRSIQRLDDVLWAERLFVGVVGGDVVDGLLGEKGAEVD